MRITNLTLSNFKRFTHLELSSIPASAKLVLLIGANGSGKSSVFDALEVLNKVTKESNGRTALSYYRKETDSSFEVKLTASDGSTLRLHDFGPADHVFAQKSASFYGRTSFRQTPRLTRTAIGQIAKDVEADADRPRFFIDRDERFENDVDRIVSDIVRSVFTDPRNTPEIVSGILIQINTAFSRIFEEKNGTSLQILDMAPPADGRPVEINFRKGGSKFHYDLLSAGEKEVFNVLLNLLARREQYQDTVYFYDELDLHLNTAVQSRFLAEITEHWIPENCQLWTASHSLGFIDYARKSDLAVILDFDNLDFDRPQTIYPQAKELLELYEIAVPRPLLFEMLRGKRIVVCENKNDEYYNLLGLPDTVFVGLKDSRDVFLHVKRDDRYTSLRDRDFLSDTEIERIQHRFPKHRILRYYDFENYLYHPDNLAELNPAGFDKTTYVEEITKQKNERLLYDILPKLVSSRQNYEEFKTDDIPRDKDTNSIVEDLRSDDFERFYKFFDMKAGFKKHLLEPFNLSVSALVSTHWFKSQIAALLG